MVTTDVLEGMVLVDEGTVTTVVEVNDCEVEKDELVLEAEVEVAELDVALVTEELDGAVVTAEEEAIVVACEVLEVTVVSGTVVTPVVP